MMPGSGIVFVGAEEEENLSIRSLAAFCERAGIASHIAGFTSPADTSRVLAAIGRHRPAMLGVSLAFQCDAQKGFDMLAKVRAQGYAGHIVVGGHFPTFEYRAILDSQPAIDSVLRYEGEHGLVQLYEQVVNGKHFDRVPNLVYRDGPTLRENACLHSFMDLDALPFPMREPEPQWWRGERYATLISSRGCWHSSCAYCCIAAFHAAKGAKFALRSAASVADEIAHLHRTRGTSLVQLHDDNFILATPGETCARIGDFIGELSRRGLTRRDLAFLIKIRPDGIDDAVADALVELGCVGAYVGIENASPAGLRALARGADLAAMWRSMEVLRQRRIAVNYNLLFYHPHGTVEEIRENLAFVRAHPGMVFDFARTEIVAGSPLERLVLQENRRCGSWPHWDYRLRDPVVQRAFNLDRATFHAPDTPYLPMKNDLVGLVCQSAIVRHFYPGPAAEALAAAVADLITASNAFVTRHLDQMLDLAAVTAEVTSCDNLPPAIMAFKKLVDAGCRGYFEKSRALAAEMLRLQTTERVFKRCALPSIQEMPRLARCFRIRRPVRTH
jgi:anaerobic magnesium-protoporphyrin IX monomethyl ester cyclase